MYMYVRTCLPVVWLLWLSELCTAPVSQNLVRRQKSKYDILTRALQLWYHRELLKYLHGVHILSNTRRTCKIYNHKNLIRKCQTRHHRAKYKHKVFKDILHNFITTSNNFLLLYFTYHSRTCQSLPCNLMAYSQLEHGSLEKWKHFRGLRLPPDIC